MFKYFALFFTLLTSLNAKDPYRYDEHYEYSHFGEHPVKYLIMYFSHDKYASPKKLEDVKKDLDQTLLHLKLYRTSNFKEVIGEIKKDGFYLNNEKICSGDYGTDTGFMNIGGACELGNLYYRKGFRPFFMANKITDKYIEVGEGKYRYYMKRSDFPKNAKVKKPTEITLKKELVKYDDFSKLRMKVCKIFKEGTTEEILDFLEKENVKNNLEKKNVLKRGIRLFKEYRKDFQSICSYSKLWLDPNFKKTRFRISFKSEYYDTERVFNDGGHFVGTFYFTYQNNNWRLGSFRYLKYGPGDRIKVTPEGKVTYDDF